MMRFRTGGSRRSTAYGRFARILRIYTGLVVLFVLALHIPFGGHRSLLHTRGTLFWTAMTAGGALTASGCLVLYQFRRRLDRALKADPRLACPWCTFDLSDSPSAGRCPECGSGYEHDAVRNYWSGIDKAFTRAKRTAAFPSDRPLLRDSGLTESHE